MPWMSNLDDETRAAATSKGWDRLDGDAAAQAIFKSYSNLEKMRPEQPPKDPSGYTFEGLTIKDGDKDVTPDQGFIGYMRDIAKELGLPVSVANKLASRLLNDGMAEEAALNKSMADELTAGTERLKGAWGQEYETKTKVAQDAFEALKLPKETMDHMIAAMGVDQVMELGHSLGSRMGEATFHQGSTTVDTTGAKAAPLTREEALTKRNQLVNDTTFGKKLMDGDPEAKAEFERVTRACVGDPNGNWSAPPANFGRTIDNKAGVFETPKPAGAP